MKFYNAGKIMENIHVEATSHGEVAGHRISGIDARVVS